jgi:hypothetical protein
MRWKINTEGSDEITRGQRFEFEIKKSLEDLAVGSLGLSIEEGKAVMASLQRHIVEQQCALYALFRRHCQGCGGTRPIKDYSTRTIQTVYGVVTLESPRLYPCRRCMPGVDFTITPGLRALPRPCDRRTDDAHSQAWHTYALSVSGGSSGRFPAWADTNSVLDPTTSHAGNWQATGRKRRTAHVL